MKSIKIERGALISLLEIAIRFAGKRQQTIVTSDDAPPETKELPPAVALIFSEGNLEIQASDVSSGISLNLSIENEESVAYFIPAKLLLETLSRSEDEVITLVLTDDHLAIKSSMGKTSLKSVSDDIPTLPARITTYPTEIAGSDFSQALGKVAFASLQKFDETQPGLSGVRLELDDEKDITLVATDGLRLAKYTTHLGWKQLGRADHEKAVTVPVKAIHSLIFLFSKIDTAVKIGMDEFRIAFQWDGGYLFTSLITKPFPNWKAILPNKFQTKTTFLSGFQNAVKACVIMAKDTTRSYPLIHIDVTSERTYVKSKSEIGESVVKLVPDEFEGKDLVIYLNGDLIPRQIIPDEITISMNAHNMPALFSTAEDPSWAFLLMPIQHTPQPTGG